ncbi:MAG TPA: hypothetical protein VFN14_08000 [Candidatus Limnocylindria bacterium]|nr:hypothetical protein [Candidatus Limnocylindria bacterium]
MTTPFSAFVQLAAAPLAVALGEALLLQAASSRALAAKTIIAPRIGRSEARLWNKSGVLSSVMAVAVASSILAGSLGSC